MDKEKIATHGKRIVYGIFSGIKAYLGRISIKEKLVKIVKKIPTGMGSKTIEDVVQNVPEKLKLPYPTVDVVLGGITGTVTGYAIEKLVGEMVIDKGFNKISGERWKNLLRNNKYIRWGIKGIETVLMLYGLYSLTDSAGDLIYKTLESALKGKTVDDIKSIVEYNGEKTGKAAMESINKYIAMEYTLFAVAMLYSLLTGDILSLPAWLYFLMIPVFSRIGGIIGYLIGRVIEKRYKKWKRRRMDIDEGNLGEL